MDIKQQLPPFEIGPHGVDLELEKAHFSGPNVNIATLEATAVKLSSDFGNRYNQHRAGRLMLAPVVAASGRLLDYLHNAKPRLHPDILSFLGRHLDTFQAVLNEAYECNFHNHNLLSASSILKIYLLKNRYGEKVPVESPAQMYLRLAAGMYGMNIQPRIEDDGGKLETPEQADQRAVQETIQAFWEIATWQYTPATPSILNLGTKHPQCASCHLLSVRDTLKKGMYRTLGHIAECNKAKGGVGVCCSFLRHGPISGCGFSCGVVPYVEQIDKELVAVDQKGARSGAGNVYLDVSHIDALSLIKITSPLTPVANRTRVLNVTVFMRRLFFQRLFNGEKWTLFCPAKTSDLFNSFGVEYERKYHFYETEAKNRQDNYNILNSEYEEVSNQCMANPQCLDLMARRRQLQAQVQVAFNNLIRFEVVNPKQIMDVIIATQQTSGFPFIVNADEVNLCNMQANVGPIHSGNLCVEIMQPTIMTNIARAAFEATRELEETKESIPAHLKNLMYPPDVMKTRTMFLENPNPSIEDEIGSAISMCNLSSINLQSFFQSPIPIDTQNKIDCYQQNDDGYGPPQENKRPFELSVDCISSSHHYNFQGLADASKSVVRNLNRVIDISETPNSKYSNPMNLATRPLGIGVSGYADVIARLSLPYESSHARAFNIAVFACMYFNAVAQSVQLSAQECPYFMFKRGSFTLPRNIHEPQPDYISRPIKSEADPEFHDIVHETYEGSPWFAGFFQFDLVSRRSGVWKAMGTLNEEVYDRDLDQPMEPSCWGQQPITFSISSKTRLGHGSQSTFTIAPSWESLRHAVKLFGVRNSQFLTVMPTSSTAQIMGNSESVEKPHTWLPYRQTAIGNFVVVPNALVEALDRLGLWTESIQKYLSSFDGTLRYIEAWIRRFPESIDSSHSDRFSWDELHHVMKVFTTMFETSMREHMIHSRLRAIYIDQSQSLNLFLPIPTEAKVQAMHEFAHDMCLKTGIYYLRQKVESKGANFSLSGFMLDSIEEMKREVDYEEEISETSSLLSQIETTMQSQQQETHHEESEEEILFHHHEVLSPNLSEFHPISSTVCALKTSKIEDEEECLMCGS